MRTLCVGALLASTALLALPAAAQAVKFDADDIGGVVTGAKGPEAGVWVIAETLKPSRFIKIVVTDDQGRYVIPDLPKGTYKVWTRGYGLVDSAPVEAAPGKTVNHKAVAAPSAAEAAQYYPANYWFSLIKVPDEKEFPGTGPNGNGISPRFQTQQEWIGHMKESCQFCHQLGNKATREVADIGNAVEAWDQRVQKQRDADDAYRGDLKKAIVNGTIMSNNMTAFGRQRGLQMFADWTDRIAAGALPPAPKRPEGVERNVVLSMWDFGELFIHDSSTTDKRNPTVNAGGPVYGVQNHSGQVVALDPNTGKVTQHKLTGFNGQWNMDMNNHTSIMDEKGRYWMSNTGAVEGPDHAFCTDGNLSPYAKLFPHKGRGGRFLTVYDPKTQKNDIIPVCFGSHHLHFTNDGRLFTSGDTQVVGWIDTKMWEKTRDGAKSTGWCPLVIDTNGDGKVTQDRTQWNSIAAGGSGGEGSTTASEGKASAFDPKKDTAITGFQYGMGISPKDQTYWVARYSPTVPSGVFRVDPGKSPPETCLTEYYEAPIVNGKSPAYNARGVDVDADGIAWVTFGTGKLGRFDRSKCKTLNGPTALGQHCREGWEIIDTPGPKLTGTDVGSDYFYQTWVDHHDVSGLGKGTPLLPSSVSDEVLAYLPDAKKFVQMRVPYPMGFYSRGLDGRIDDPKAGWKGKGLWGSYNLQPQWHMEGGDGEILKMVKFQVRPDPLAH
jgi:hypothetical protein